MNKITEKDISFVIVTYKSNNLIFDCLNSLPKQPKKIIVENSDNVNFKVKLENDYLNLDCFLMKRNYGYGAANNFGIRKCETKYVIILNPDVKFRNYTMNDILNIINNNNFDIGAPINFNDKNNYDFKNKKVKEVDYVKGFAIIVKKNFFLQYKFDENFFLYLEEIDLCKRIINNRKKIFLLNTHVDHIGGASHDVEHDIEMENSRNWHWMWSKFYYHKKHNGYFFSFIKTFPNFVNSIFKFLLFSIVGEEQNKNKYKMRTLGLLNSYLLKKSSFRPYEAN